MPEEASPGWRRTARRSWLPCEPDRRCRRRWPAAWRRPAWRRPAWPEIPPRRRCVTSSSSAASSRAISAVQLLVAASHAGHRRPGHRRLRQPGHRAANRAAVIHLLRRRAALPAAAAARGARSRSGRAAGCQPACGPYHAGPATLSTRIDSAAPSWLFGTPDASPLRAASAAATARRYRTCRAAGGLAVRPDHLDHLNTAASQVASQPGTIAAGALHPHLRQLAVCVHPGQRAGVASRISRECLRAQHPAHLVHRRTPCTSAWVSTPPVTHAASAILA